MAIFYFSIRATFPELTTPNHALRVSRAIVFSTLAPEQVKNSL
jgi:hypothetical protein